MSIENELKLRVAPEHLNVLMRHPLLKKLSTERATTRRLFSIYYDTPDLYLHQRAMVLRLCRVGKQWLQTLKVCGDVQAGLHQRKVWDAPVDGESVDFDALKSCDGKHLAFSLRKKLKPLFVTDFSRTSRMLAFDGTEIRLKLDRGEVRSGENRHPISELELELKSGESAQLFNLAADLLDIVPLEVEHASKAEYGYLLYRTGETAISKANFPGLAEATGVAPALQDMICSCLLHLQANVSGTIQKLDEEYLHQVRIALRRLRVILAMTASFRADDELSQLHEQVAKLHKEFGRLREWDVFMTQTLAPIRTRLLEQDELRLLNASEKLREQHHAAVENSLRSPDYQRILLRFGAWIHGGYWREAAEDGLTLPNFAAQILDKRGRQVKKLGKDISSASPRQLHVLRIACKKLRYSAEMFASLFDPAKTKSGYLAALAKLQDILGTLNDIVVANRLLDELDAGVRHESTLLIRAWIKRESTDNNIKLNKAWKRFSAQKAFWHPVARKTV